MTTLLILKLHSLRFFLLPHYTGTKTDHHRDQTFAKSMQPPPPMFFSPKKFSSPSDLHAHTQRICDSKYLQRVLVRNLDPFQNVITLGHMQDSFIRTDLFLFRRTSCIQQFQVRTQVTQTCPGSRLLLKSSFSTIGLYISSLCSNY